MRTPYFKLTMSLLLGVTIGAVGTWLRLRSMIAQQVLDCTSGQVVLAVDKLTLARKGDSQRLIQESEAELSIAILSLIPSEQYLSERQKKLLLAANRYYQNYPAAGDPNYDAVIKPFLGRLSESIASPEATAK